MSETNWLRRFITANLRLWEPQGATVKAITTATGYASRDVTAELELMQAKGLAVETGDRRWHLPGRSRAGGRQR